MIDVLTSISNFIKWILILAAMLPSIQAQAKIIAITCVNKQGYPSIELDGDDSILSKPGMHKARLKGLKNVVAVTTKFSSGKKRLQLTIKSITGNKTSLIEVKSPKEAFDAWDGAGTMAYGPDQAEQDFKRFFGSKTNEKVMIVQQQSKFAVYPKPGGFCILNSR